VILESATGVVCLSSTPEPWNPWLVSYQMMFPFPPDCNEKASVLLPLPVLMVINP